MKQWIAITALASAGVAAAPIGMDTFRAWDHDGDGFVNPVEAQSSVDLAGRFNEFDANLDGRISAAEMEAWLARPLGKREAWPPKPIRSQLQWEAVNAALEGRRVQPDGSGATGATPAPTGEAPEPGRKAPSPEDH